MKQYRLLRSNKESGPYTAAELISLGLKPYDLVWMDGKSAAWRYPSEMEEFKALVPAVEEQPFDRFFKRKDTSMVHNSQTVAQPSVEAATAVAPAPKPRIRIKADWNRVEQPIIAEINQVAAQAPQPKQQQTAVPAAATKIVNNASWQSSWLDWQQEQDAVNNTAKNEASKPEKPKTVNYLAAESTAPEMETKFSESLDSLKLRYAETVLKTKGNAKEWYKFKGTATLLLLAIPVLGFGVWLGSGLHGSSAQASKPVAANTVPVVMPAADTQQQASDSGHTAGVGVQGNTDQKAEAAPVKPNSNSKELVPSFDNDENNDKPAEPEKATQPAKKAVVKKAYVAPWALVKRNVKPFQQQNKKPVPPPQQQYAFTPPVNTNTSGRNKVINPALAAASANNGISNQAAPARQQETTAQYNAQHTEPENASPIFSHYSKQQKIEDFVSVEADQPYQQAIQNVALNVENVTDATIDLVVIDVQYYDQNGRFKAGQSMYIKNIPVNETVRAKIPDNTKASKIKYRVSLVSVEQKGVYLVAE